MNLQIYPVLISIALGVSASAVTVTGDGGTFVIDEQVGGNGVVEYRFDLLDPSSTVAAVVISYVEDGTDSVFAIGQGGVLSNSWESVILTDAEWDGSVTYSLATGSTFNTTALGSFETLFGTTDDRVAVFYNSLGLGVIQPLDESLDSDEANWATDNPTFGRSQALISSEAITIGGAGSLLDSSLPVPEPSGFFLSALGVLVLLGRKRR